MIIKNPETGHIFYKSTSKKGFQTVGAYTFENTQNGLVCLGKGNEKNRDCYDSGDLGMVFIELDENKQIKIYPDPMDARKIAFNVLHVNFDKDVVQYKEILFTEKDINYVNINMNPYSLYTRKEKDFLDTMIKGFVEKFQQMHMADICGRHVLRPNGSMAVYYTFLASRIFNHQYFYYKNKKYREMTDNGFADCCINIVDVTFEYASNNRINVLYNFLQGRQFDELSVEEQGLYYSAPTDKNSILELFFKYNFTKQTYSLFTKLVGTADNHNLKEFKKLLVYMPDYRDDNGRFDANKTLALIKRILSNNNSRATIKNALDHIYRISAIKSREETKKIIELAKNFHDLQLIADSIEMNYRMEKKQLLNKNLFSDDFRNNCSADEFEMYKGSVYRFIRVTDIYAISKQLSDMLVTHVDEILDTDIVFIICTKDGQELGILKINTRTKEYRQVDIGSSEINANQIEKVVDAMVKKYINQFHYNFLNRDI